MAEPENQTAPLPSMEQIQQAWNQFTLRIEKLETLNTALEHENIHLRRLLERSVEYRRKSHTDLVNLITTLVSKLPFNDLGGIITRLVEHNNQVVEISAALLGGKIEEAQLQPAILKMLDKTKRDLAAAIKPLVTDLIQRDTPMERSMLESLIVQPEDFFKPSVVRGSRCFVKGHLPRERVIREFGEPALVFFKDLTTDLKYNPRPKPEEIVLGFVPDFETVLQQNPAAIGEKKEALLALYRKIKESRGSSESARAQKTIFLKLSFILEMLHYYNNQSTESPDAVFAQRLPPLIEQLVITSESDSLDEKNIQNAEELLGYVLHSDYRMAIINNLGKAGGLAKTLRLVLTLRLEKAPEPDEAAQEMVKHLIPSGKAPAAADIAPVLRLIHPNRLRKVLEAMLATDRIAKPEAGALAKAVAQTLHLPGMEDLFRSTGPLSPAKEQELAWNNIKDLIATRATPLDITQAIRKRLHAKFDNDELKASWLVLTESDPLLLIRIFCQLPYLQDGQTDPIARSILESFVSRLTHEKYGEVYQKVVGALKNIHKVKADSPALVNFISLVRWVDAEAANRISNDVGMVPAAA